MQNTPNFNFMIAEGTDTVNLLTQCYPNFTSLDSILQAIKETGVTTATATKTGTNFAVVRTDTDCNFFRFVATANYVAGDTFTVDGVPVTATSAAGTALPSGAFVINQSVIAILNSAVLTVLVGGGLSSVDADDVSYDNTLSGLTASDVQAAIDEVVSDIPTGFAATAITYDNTVSGLTASNVQAAIDELKALIPTVPQYVTTGLNIVSGRVTINQGGYYISGSTVYVDITITAQEALSAEMGVIEGFPQAASIGDATPIYNKCQIQRTASTTRLRTGTGYGLNNGETVRFINSYTM